MTAASVQSMKSRESMILLGGEGEILTPLQSSPRCLMVRIDMGKGNMEAPPVRVELSEGATLELGGPRGGAMVNDEGLRCTLEEFVSTELKQNVTALYYKKGFSDDAFAAEMNVVAVVAPGEYVMRVPGVEDDGAIVNL